MKYKMVFSYNGRDFNGYQIQDGVRTVQEDIETLLHSLFQENIRIYSSGRTYRGVHAINQVASFKTVKYFEPNKLKYVMNRLLTKDIHIKSIEEENNVSIEVINTQTLDLIAKIEDVRENLNKEFKLAVE